jgi:hypothetical protein
VYLIWEDDGVPLGGNSGDYAIKICSNPNKGVITRIKGRNYANQKA